MTKTYMQWGDEASYGPAGYVNNSRLSRKVGLSSTPNRHDTDSQRIFAAVKDSLERLGTDYIDVYQVRLICPLTNRG